MYYNLIIINSTINRETYNPDNNHTRPFEVIALYDPVLKGYLLDVTRKRIEIDIVLAKVGNGEFWDFVIHKLTERFPTRNYNRASLTSLPPS
jgi:hypothetical protein